jgi:hypothetical protein
MSALPYLQSFDFSRAQQITFNKLAKFSVPLHSDEDVHLTSQIQNSVLLMAEDIGLIRPIKERQYFLYLVRKSDLFSVYQELNEAKQVKQ